MAKIFDPIRIGKIELKNRIMFAATMTNFAYPDGSVSDELIAFLTNIAAGEVGMIVTGHGYVDDIASKGYQRMLGCHRPGLGLEKIAKAVKEYDCACLVQLNHTGPKAHPSLTKGLPRGPVSGTFNFRNYPQEIQGLTVEEIDEIVKAYGRAAARVEEAGFDGVEVHGGHNYLISQFTSPAYNKRTDRYGGDLEGRATLALEVLSSIKEKISEDFVLGIRFNGVELMEGGLPLEEGIKLAQLFKKVGVDYLNVSQTAMVRQAAVPSTFDPPGQWTYVAEKVKEVASLPVAGVGGLHTPELIEKALEEEKMDIVAICRGLIADAHLVKKMKERRQAEQRTCIRCNLCMKRTWDGIPIMCSINPMVGRMASRDLKPVEENKRGKVVVVGGGVAGMEAARIAAKKGHNVTLYEMSAQMGGQVLTTSAIEDMFEFKRLINYYTTTLDSHNAVVKLNHKISAHEINQLQPDAVIWATGAEERIPDIPGAKQSHVTTGTAVLMGKGQVDGDVAVIGASMIGCQVALHLANLECNVKLICKRPKSRFAEGLMMDNVETALLRKLGDKDVTYYDETELLEIKENALRLKNREGEEAEIEIDYVVFTEPFVPITDINREMISENIAVFQAGDCTRPKNIYAAIHQGANVVFELTKRLGSPVT